ncbi:hypothetical protein G352_13020 [Rhodococcus ruber BKS 20-38]|uniref:Chorismatase FkbO/Hyg5-like N-terminal domain-containing protein n=1 Tax=Rhodococcus ruber BKS 20-38 TaxID=1278076 RepID=M2ZV23_9NOCA|nr:FkbO/Hyg5 family chorismatase [Rhodococcus ruber]EME64204.1 hypothetical protein G352_13020 [Rhodococcus ruber BKS 20-38]
MTRNLNRTFLPVPLLSAGPDTSDSGNVLGAVHYTDRHADPHLDNGHPDLTVHMVGDAAESFSEVWYTDHEITHGELNGVAYSYDGHHFFCAGRVEQSASYTDGVRDAYVTALGLTCALDYPRVFRMWNFVEDINTSNGAGLEIYRDFCRGRAQAFDRLAIPDDQLPAATGIGSLGGGIGFCLLASRSDCVNIENPRQMPAYRYPDRYGPRSPSFARATHIAPPEGRAGLGHIYVSGTASIVGHRTVHQGDVASQCREALTNIAHLISAENLSRHNIGPGRDITDLRNVKVYVRHDRDVDTVRDICTQVIGSDQHLALFTVDICRADLLVEIEGVVLD